MKLGEGSPVSRDWSTSMAVCIGSLSQGDIIEESTVQGTKNDSYVLTIMGGCYGQGPFGGGHRQLRT